MRYGGIVWLYCGGTGCEVPMTVLVECRMCGCDVIVSGGVLVSARRVLGREYASL